MKRCAVVLWLVLAGVLSVMLSAGTLKQEETALDKAFDSDRYMELLGGALFSEGEILEEYAFIQDMLLPVMVPSGDEYRHRAGVTVVNPDKFAENFLKGLLPRESKAAGIYTYRITVREQDLPYGGRERAILNEEGKEIWQVKLPYDYDPWAYLRQTHPEVFGLGAAKTESAYAEFLFMVYNPGRVVVTMDLLLEEDLINYVWAESVNRLLVAETLAGGTVESMRDGGGITNIAFTGVSQTNGTLTFTLSYPDTFTSALCVVGSTNLVTRDWTLLAETNASSETNQLFITDDASPENYRWFAAYNDNYDGDGDGVVNGEEFFLDHSDPANPHDPPNIYGAVSYQTYSGGQTGTVYALAVASSNSCSTNYGNALPMPDDYHLTKLPAGYYWIRAWRDSDGNRTCGVYEASGYFTNNAVYVTGQVSAADILMTDPDTDSDGMGDWWEINYWDFTFQQLGTGDADIDKLMNLYEYYAGTDPTTGFEDSDGDGIADDWERFFDLDRYDPTDADDDPDQDGFTSLEEYLSGSNGTDPTDPLSHPDTGNYVATNGVDAAGYGSYTNPYATISYAFSQAAEGEHVIILPGVYIGATNRNISFEGKNLTVTGLQGQESNTVIDCESSGRAFSITSGETNAVIRHLTIINGRYTGTAGAINVGNAHLTLLACNLTSNTAVGGTAGALLVNGGSALVEESTFTGNSASGNGGAIYINGQTSQVSWCSFTDNSGMNGSAISASSELTIDHCMICSNISSYYGGALYSEDRLIVENSLLKENINGAIASEVLFYGSYLTLQNCTLVGCANPYSAALVNHAEHDVGITNCILKANGNYPIGGSSSNRVVAYSCFPGTNVVSGIGNITNDPRFQIDGWHLELGSPCYNAGINCEGGESNLDLDGAIRIQGNSVDMGADEIPVYTHYVDIENDNPVSPFLTWATAATNIQDAVQCAAIQEVVLVTNGEYATGEYPVGDGMACRVAITNQCVVMSVNGAEYTTIRGQGPDGASAVRCVYIGTNCLLDGFSLVSGHTDTAGGSLLQDGGGVWSEVSGKVINCVISNCSARNGGGIFGGNIENCLMTFNEATFGGGVYAGVMNECIVSSNTASINGGGLFSAVVTNCVLRGNVAISGGGAYSSLVVACVVSNNYATYGGGLYGCETHRSWLQMNDVSADGGGAYEGLLRSCLIISNAAVRGGGVFGSTVENCTICDNSAVDGGGSWSGALVNTIIYYNTPDNHSTGTFYSCCTTPYPNGYNNITNVPDFESRYSYIPKRGAISCDAGYNYAWMETARDIGENQRVMDEFVDMGAYECADYYITHMPSFDQSNKWGAVIAGQPATIWITGRVATNQYPVKCWFNYGDGINSSTLTVSDATAFHCVGTSHTYLSVGIYNVTSYVQHSSGSVFTQKFSLSCLSSNDYDACMFNSVRKGLLWLYTNAHAHKDGYYWQHDRALYSHYKCSANGMAISAFSDFGDYTSLSNCAYARFLKKGIRYLLVNCLSGVAVSTNACNYDPDANTNGFGVSISGDKPLYEVGSAMKSLVKAGFPDALAPALSHSNVSMRMYKDVVQDIVDYCCWAQMDGGAGQGGWRYYPNDGADNSASFWPVLGLNQVSDWGINVPDGLRSELEIWTQYSQAGSGGFGYTDSSDSSFLRTACGLCQLILTGQDRTDSAVRQAIEYIGQEFSVDVEDLYGMHCLAEACNTIQPEIEYVNTQSWRYEYSWALQENQNQDGSWDGHNSGSYISKVFGTSAAISILSECSPWRIIAYSVNHSPENVSTNDDVSVESAVIIRPGYTNLNLTTWYRAATNDPFTSITMTNAESIFYTASAIPAQTNGTLVEYYVTALYSHDDTTITQRYPSAYTEDLFSYEVE